MRVGLITFFRNNYGSELQCYATKHFLENHDIECDVLYIEEYEWEKIKSKITSLGKIIGYSILYKDFWANRKHIVSSIKGSSSTMLKESKFGLDWFCESILQPKGIEYKLAKNRTFQKNYDYFICGSDQIWGGAYLVHPFMFLEFAEDTKKIALAPSFGVEQIKHFNTKKFKKEISKISILSSREESGARIIEQLTSRKVPRLADPVNLLTIDEWTAFAEKGVKQKEKYIFVHFLNKPKEIALKSIRSLSKNYRLKILCFANDYVEFSNLGGYEKIGGTPYDYVSLISNACFVCTDSFHTSQISIIFNKSFFTFERNYGHENSQSSRLQNLFSLYHCMDRFITNERINVLELSTAVPNFKEIRNNERMGISDFLLNSIHYDSNISDSNTQLKSADKCTGCMACQAICPVGAINIDYSNFGYQIPKIDGDKCLNCKLCIKVCHSEIVALDCGTNSAYIAFNTNDEFRKKSASGGAFSAIAYAFIKDGGLVCGSRLSFEYGNPVIKHVIIKNIEELDSILGSKYVESNCSEVYESIFNSLKSGKKVLFCGTSCQVKALYSYLKIKKLKTKNLFTIDLICHGVAGCKLFSEYTDSISEKENMQFQAFSFRKKTINDIRFQITGNLVSDNCKKEISIPITQSSYYDMFMHQDSYREQCYHCEYASANKPADITIGDYFEARRDYSELFKDGSVLHDVDFLNCLLVNSERGKALLSEYGMQLFLYEVSRQRVQLSHSNLCKPSSYSTNRLILRDAFEKNGQRGIDRKYKGIFLKKKILRNGKKIISSVWKHSKQQEE